MRDVVRGIGAVLHSSWRGSPRRLLVSAVLMLLGSISGPLIALFLKVATDSVLAHDIETAVYAAVAIALAALLSLTMEHFAHIFFFELADLHQVRVEQEVGDLLQGTAGLEQQERSDHADRLELLRKATGSIGEGVQTVLASATLLVQITLTASLLAYLEPWLLLLPLFTVPPLLAGRLAEIQLKRAEEHTAEASRLSWHFMDLAVSPAAAKEVRLFGLQHVLRRRQSALLSQIDARLRRSEAAGLGLRIAGQFVFAIGYLGAVTLIVRAAVTGERSVGDVVLVLTLAVQTNAQSATAVALAQSLQRNARAMALVRWLRRSAPRNTVYDAPCPGELRTGISLSDVAFRYPGTDQDVLSGVTMQIPAGTTVAIVGDNGAGKSTLVKLLCGFYQPTQGTITVDDVELRHIDPAHWRSRIAAGFQDFVRLDATARESIGVGDLSRLAEPGAVESAVDRADAQRVIDRLPAGLDSHLGHAYEDGEDLSGGQWQKIALSRAMMREQPLLLLLDEPTAALDPLTEHELFERYAESAGLAARRNGAVTVFVSHRFSTVRMADMIVVVSGGRIAEAGDHEHLMRLNKTYAELFTLQASVYR